MLDSLNGAARHAAQRVNPVIVAKSPLQWIRAFARARAEFDEQVMDIRPELHRYVARICLKRIFLFATDRAPDIFIDVGGVYETKLAACQAYLSQFPPDEANPEWMKELDQRRGQVLGVPYLCRSIQADGGVVERLVDISILDKIYQYSWH